MSTRDLQADVLRSHDAAFGSTTPRERLRDLQHQIAELVHAPPERLADEIGDAGWALLQLCNEQGVDFERVVRTTIESLADEVPGKHIALIGTSANPITNAHLTLGLEVLALTDVDEVWYQIVGKHAWGKKLIPAEHRLEMARLATARYPRLKVSDFEVAHGEQIYAATTQTAEILRDFLFPAFPKHRFSFVMGSDVATSFHEWGGSDWMAEHMRIIVIHRLGYTFDKATSILADDRHLYLREDIVTSNISSTLVRERGRAYDGRKLLALVPDIVWNYLAEHRLLDPEVLKA